MNLEVLCSSFRTVTKECVKAHGTEISDHGSRYVNAWKHRREHCPAGCGFGADLIESELREIFSIFPKTRVTALSQDERP